MTYLNTGSQFWILSPEETADGKECTNVVLNHNHLYYGVIDMFGNEDSDFSLTVKKLCPHSGQIEVLCKLTDVEFNGEVTIAIHDY